MSNEETRWAQKFFDEVEPIRLLDPLAEALGAVEAGEPLIYTYKDAVKLAGHSCPAVAGAYRLTQKALKALYPNQTPVRGQVKVVIKGEPSHLAYGPQSQVISLITGAAGETGYKGIAGKHSRRNKLIFDRGDFQFNTFIFIREDTLKAVRVVFNPQAIPGEPALVELTGPALSGSATEEQKKQFKKLWQGGVRKILLEDHNYPGLFEVEEIEGYTPPPAA